MRAGDARAVHLPRGSVPRELPLGDLRIRRDPRVHGHPPARGAQPALRPIGQPRRAARPALPARRQQQRGRALLHAHRGSSRRDATVPRPAGRRGNRRSLRRRLDSCDLRDHAGHVHRLHVQHLRHPRAALAVLPARWRDRQVPLPEAGPIARPDLRRRQDALGGPRQGARGRVAGRDRDHPRHFRGGVAHREPSGAVTRSAC